jgi:hypothetical protein
MEPVFMILGQSCASAACMALDDKISVQDVPYAKLREQLLKDGQVLEYKAPAKAPGDTGKSANRKHIDKSKLEGVVVDDSEAKLEGSWTNSGTNSPFVEHGYQHDSAAKDGKCIARFEAKLPAAGKYEVRFAYPANSNRASNIPVEIQTVAGAKTVYVNEKKDAPIDDTFVSLGVFEFAAEKPAVVKVSNLETDGYVVVDAVQWLPVK